MFQLKVTGSNSLNQESFESYLNMIDLAGCERVDESGATGKRLEEAKAINSSLSHLGTVIHALSNTLLKFET